MERHDANGVPPRNEQRDQFQGSVDSQAIPVSINAAFTEASWRIDSRGRLFRRLVHTQRRPGSPPAGDKPAEGQHYHPFVAFRPVDLVASEIGAHGDDRAQKPSRSGKPATRWAPTRFPLAENFSRSSRPRVRRHVTSMGAESSQDSSDPPSEAEGL